MRIEKKSMAIVTGATGIIGSSIVRKLLYKGLFVVMIGRDVKQVKKIIKDVGNENIMFVDLDITNIEEVRIFFNSNIFEKNKLEMLVAAAGVLTMEYMEDCTEDVWSHVINTNLSAVYRFIRGSLKFMEIQNKGDIFILGSRWGESGAASAAAYSASKSALRGLVKSLQLELSDSGIRVFLVSPGSVKSRMSNQVNKNIKEDLILPEDVADLIVYMSNTDNRVIFDEIFIKSYKYDLKK